MATQKTTKDPLESKSELRRQLDEALAALDAIRTGQVDALVVHDGTKHELYTLQSADRAYRAFIEHMSEGAVTLHADGTINYANSQFGALVALPLPELIGQPFVRYVAPDSVKIFEELIEECRQRNECRREIELYSHGHRIPVLVSLTGLLIDDMVSFPMLVTDLREQKKVQQQLEERNRALSASNYDLQQFASAAAHDLQEPLRKISTFVSVIMDEELVSASKRLERYLEKISASATRMRQLIVDVLSFSQLSAGEDQFVQTDLNKLMEALLEDFDLLIEQKKVVVHVDPLPVVAVQPAQISQALRNLLSNALKFNRNGNVHEVWISSVRVGHRSFTAPEQPDGPYCILRIRDNGIGFDETYLDKIFGLFQRLHSHDAYEGTGIGLAVTKKIVERHDGLIEASGQPGEGAEFRILLPMRRNG